MELLISLGRTLGFSLTSGVNLYATVAVLGLAARFEWVALPPQYQVFNNDWIIGAAITMYVIEFVADKIPWVDSMWDSVHTLIRPAGGAAIAIATLGEASPGFQMLIGLAGGAIAAGGHLTKASARVAANASPEPFTNWMLSFVEDVFVLGLGLLALKYPLAALVITALILVAIVMALRWIVKQLRRVMRKTAVAAALVLAVSAALVAQEASQKPEQTPRFRAGANLVRLDAYVSADGQAVTDLKADDFEVLEDGVPQRVENFEVIRPRPSVADTARVEPNTVADARTMATDPSARLFVLFLDVWHVHIEGSYRAQNPMTNLLNSVIGQDDMVGVMTPEMSARNVTFARRTTTIEGIFRDNWFWGERQRVNSPDPREEELKLCYPDAKDTAGIAEELIDRRRERKTLDSIEDLIIHLEGIRDERKFVILLSEGWRLPRRNDRLARVIPGYGIPGVDPISVQNGRIASRPPAGNRNYDTCERERQRLSAEDFELDFRTLLQRANRANVSFYTFDPRGLVVFDEDLSSRRATDIVGDRNRLTARQDALRELALNTDGVAILNTNNVQAALQRMLQDINVYYLLGYYSTNTKLDGRFRKITVRVKRPGVHVRARPGYLAPTEAEAASARVTRLMNGAAPGFSDTPPELRRALDSLAPARGAVPLRVHAAAGPAGIWLTTEIDPTVIKGTEWAEGARAHVTMEHERGEAAPLVKDVTLEPGQRSFSFVENGNGNLPPGRYVIRLALTAKGGSLPVQTTTDVTIPAKAALIGVSGIVSRRGPSTGLDYRQTADARFQRTERVRFEVPRFGPDGVVSARLLNRNGQLLPLTVTLSERRDETLQLTLIVADLTLAPLAQGEYVLEVAIEKDGKKERAAYGFRIVP